MIVKKDEIRGIKKDSDLYIFLSKFHPTMIKRLEFLEDLNDAAIKIKARYKFGKKQLSAEQGNKLISQYYTIYRLYSEKKYFWMKNISEMF